MKTINQYAGLVKEKHALNSTIAPTETDLTSASRGYAVGEQFIYDGTLYTVGVAITQGSVITLADHIASNDIVTQMAGNKTSAENAIAATNAAVTATQQMLAPVETDATSASDSYAVGDQLILGGVLYDVTAAITAGDALTVGTNIAAADDVTDQLSTLNSALTNEAATRSAMGAKNLLDVGARYRAGTMDSKIAVVDDVITVNGTQTTSTTLRLCPVENDNSYVLPAGTYIIVGESSDANLTMSMRKNGDYLYNSLDPSTPREFTANGTDYFQVLMHLNVDAYSNATMKLMICTKAEYELAPAWQHYAKTNKELTEDSVDWDDYSELGAVNFVVPNFTTKVVSGVTFTVNDDGSITASGTATANCSTYSVFTLPKGTYRLSGCPSGGSTSGNSGTFRLSLVNALSSAVFEDGNGDGVVFTTTEDKVVTLYTDVRNGWSGTLTFKPMITPVSYNGSYVPYAKTNRELTEDVAELDGMYNGKVLDAVSDLDAPLTIGGSIFAVNRFASSALNNPSSGSGAVLTWSSSANYGAQIAFNDQGLYYRKNSGGTLSAWQTLTT